MSTPPVPPPAPGYGYGRGQAPGYGYSKAQIRAQRRLAEAQARSRNNQLRSAVRNARLQRSASQRSIVGPILLLALGVLLLFGQTGHLDWSRLLSWYSRWWPAILVGAGALLLFEWAVDQKRSTNSVQGPRVLGPGVGLLLLLLAGVGWSLSWFPDGMREQARGLRARGFMDQLGVPRLLSQEYEWNDAAATDLPASWPVAIRNPHGDVTVSGTSTDGRIHLVMHKRAYAWQQSSAEELRRALQPRFSRGDGRLLLEIPEVSNAEADLTVQIPEGSGLDVRVEHGDTAISGIHAPVTVSSKGGDLSLKDVVGNVFARVNDDHATVSAESLRGSVKLQGRTGDLRFADVQGTLSLEGDFFGSTHLEQVTDAVIFRTSRTQFEAAGLTGSLDLDGGPEFQADGVLGPVVLNARDRNITLDNVTGAIQLGNRNGSVHVMTTAPIGNIQISNERGSVDLAIPEKTGFRLAAEVRNGDLENDFDVPTQVHGDITSSNGAVGAGGPDVHLSTSDGGMTVREQMKPRVLDHAPGQERSSVSKPPLGKHLRGSKPTLQQM